MAGFSLVRKKFCSYLHFCYNLDFQNIQKLHCSNLSTCKVILIFVMKTVVFNTLCITIMLTIMQLMVCTPVSAQQSHKVNLNALLEETQQTINEGNKIQIVWWIPLEYWEAALREDDSVSEDEIQETLEVLRPYEMFAILNGRVSTFGTVTYKPKDWVKENLSLITSDNAIYTPLDDDDIGFEAQMLLTVIQPILSNMIGSMGENMFFFVFDAQNDDDERILDPLSDDKFVVQMAEEEFTFRLPLGALLAPKKCPVDGEMMNGAWNYCPYHGKKLIDADNK